LLEITNPPVTKVLYAVTGEIKSSQVQGDGYLEMWNFFPPAKPGMQESHYFSRTLGASGEMGKITGTSDWRAFVLPFNRTGGASPPTKLEINLFLPAQGTVYIGPLRLVEFEGGSANVTKTGAWWSDRTAGWIGGIGGAIIGCAAGLLAWLASQGRARAFVLALSKALIAVGAAFTLGGVAALLMGQPYAVWFPLLLVGVLLLLILPYRLRQYEKQYQDLELRKMSAVDALEG
jgi:hypothetical protein